MSGGSRGVDIDLALYGLPPSLRHKLKAKGFRTDSDFLGLQPLELAAGGFVLHNLLGNVLLPQRKKKRTHHDIMLMQRPIYRMKKPSMC